MAAERSGLMKECIPHHICECKERRMRALEELASMSIWVVLEFQKHGIEIPERWLAAARAVPALEVDECQ